jgi:capsular polysaccharide biosynthesis protein
MNLDQFIQVISRRRYVVAVVVAVLLIVSPFVLIKFGTSYVGTANMLLINDGGPQNELVPVEDLPVVIMSPTVLNRVRHQFNLPYTLEEFQKLVGAQVSLKSSIIPVTYRDTDRERARDIVNAIADQSARYYKELAAQQYQQLNDYLSATASSVRARMIALDRRLQESSAAHPQIGPADALDKLSTRLQDLAAQRGEAYATLVADQAIAGAQAKQNAAVAGVVRNETLLNDPFVTALRTSVSKDASTLATEHAQYTDAFPGLASLTDQVTSEQGALHKAETESIARGPSSPTYASTVLDQRRADATVAGDQARVAALDNQLSKAYDDLATLPTNGVHGNDLRSELDTARASYAALIARKTQAGGDQAQAASLAALVVIGRAYDAWPRIPLPILAVLVTLAILILAASAAFLFDALDSGLRSRDDIERLYGRPVVATLGSK